MNRIKTIKLVAEDMMSGPMNYFFQLAMEENVCAIDKIRIGFPPEDVPFIDDLQGYVYAVFWKGNFRAIVRTANIEDAKEHALNWCEKTGNAFATIDRADPTNKIMEAPNGKLVTDEFLEVKLFDSEICRDNRITIWIRFGNPFFERENKYEEPS